MVGSLDLRSWIVLFSVLHPTTTKSFSNFLNNTHPPPWMYPTHHTPHKQADPSSMPQNKSTDKRPVPVLLSLCNSTFWHARAGRGAPTNKKNLATFLRHFLSNEASSLLSVAVFVFLCFVQLCVINSQCRWGSMGNSVESDTKTWIVCCVCGSDAPFYHWWWQSECCVCGTS